jgi:transcriptional regulator with XRE-family HTH domain
MLANQQTPFADLLRTWRADRTCNQARLILGLGFHTYQGWEAGKVLPRDRDLAHVADVLGQPADTLRALVAADRARRAAALAPTPIQGHPVLAASSDLPTAGPGLSEAVHAAQSAADLSDHTHEAHASPCAAITTMTEAIP